ncbi:MAG: hypothetical protein OHK0039_38820 [Bacteroidia bacterium]
MKLLISAYACEPHVGSEPGVGWNWVLRLAGEEAYSEVHVVTRTGDRYIDEEGHKQVRPSKLHIEQELPHTGLAHKITFHYYDLPAWIANLERSLAGDMINVYLWELMVFFFLRKRFRRRAFDVVQRVTIVSHRFPSMAWFFGKKFILGPIAGGEHYPLLLLPLFAKKNRIKELARYFFQLTPLFDPLVRFTWAQADELIATTPETRKLLPRRVRSRCRIEQAVSMEDFAVEATAVAPQPGPLRLLFVGRLLEWKGLGLVLRAMKLLKHVPHTLTVVGAGEDEGIFREYAEREGLPVVFAGFVPRQELGQYYTSHDLFVFPSLRDSGGFVVLEAQAYGLPVLTLDLGGPYMNLDTRRGIAVPTQGRDVVQLSQAIAAALLRFDQQRPPSLRTSQATNPQIQS